VMTVKFRDPISAQACILVSICSHVFLGFSLSIAENERTVLCWSSCRSCAVHWQAEIHTQ
jgi:hypothetical protein